MDISRHPTSTDFDRTAAFFRHFQCSPHGGSCRHRWLAGLHALFWEPLGRSLAMKADIWITVLAQTGTPTLLETLHVWCRHQSPDDSARNACTRILLNFVLVDSSTGKCMCQAERAHRWGPIQLWVNTYSYISMTYTHICVSHIWDFHFLSREV